MTEHEAEALVARLTRVWEPGSFEFSINNKSSPHSSDFEFVATLKEGLTLEVTFGASWLTDAENFELSRNKISLLCEDGRLRSWNNVDPLESEQAFASQYLPFFRRNCWLSGCDIEASAHEKAEWIEGFTREEIESWNLKV